MTKKHFVALADSIREHNRCSKSNTQYTSFTTDQLDTLARFCTSQNGRFNRSRWLAYVNGECGPNGGQIKVQAKDEGIRPYGPGKFSTILDSYVYSVSLDGGCDTEEGSVSENGVWYGLMRHGRTIFKDHDPSLETLNAAEERQLTSAAGVILTEDSQGFVSVGYYDTEKALDVAWSEIESRFAEPNESEQEAS